MAVSTTELTPSSTPSANGGPTGPALAAQWSFRLVAVFALIAAILFSSAWTFQYWQAAVYLLVVFIPAAAVSFTLLFRNPAIIARRLQTAERSRSQQALIRAFRPLFLLLMFVPGLDHRLGLTRTIVGQVSVPLTLVGDGLIVAALLFAGWVFRVNEFAGRSIRVEEDQRAVDRGPYGLVRHPLYSASMLLWLATPLALGSWIALPLFALMIPFYVLRLMNEELQLTSELRGYVAYCKRTPFRLIPFLW
jgi:protein-S-isoprenylcysteine O-methyltransferase Ste14